MPCRTNFLRGHICVCVQKRQKTFRFFLENPPLFWGKLVRTYAWVSPIETMGATNGAQKDEKLKWKIEADSIAFVAFMLQNVCLYQYIKLILHCF